MIRTTRPSGYLWTQAFSLAGMLLLTAGFAAGARAADSLQLAAVKPIVACEQLAQAELSQAAGAVVVIKSASVQPTPKGPFCKVLGTLESYIRFEVALPVERWTQRFAQAAATQGRLAVNNAGSCMPATNGELALAVNDRGGSRSRGGFASDPEKRIGWAYRSNHQTALIAKALIKIFYGQAPRFSYFVGCSGGGREALVVAQRYPNDFDGISAGAPAIVLNVHNGGFFHGWESHVNRRADGSVILVRSRLGVLHDAVIAHCAAKASALDGILQAPTACKFDPAWVRCASGATDTAKCLSGEETTVAQELYEGASVAGRRFLVSGFPLGSERMWALSTPRGPGDAQSKPGLDLKYLLPLPESEAPVETLDAEFRFNQEWFDKLGELAPLYNGANTNLRSFQQHGGKLILWHGAADTSVQPELSIAYFQGVQRELGAQLTDTFMRFYLLPGVAHCSGGEGPAQIDVLSPLMAWTELRRAPEKIVVGKPASQHSGIPADGPAQPDVARAAVPMYPYSSPDQPPVLTRPVYPFPSVARYTGRGDAKDAVNYERVKSAAPVPQSFDAEAMKLIGPDNQKFYRVAGGKLVAGNQ
ncbi:MAG: tannase/feruloyl esterase family alpha/beta hydrolase [Gammaproteobacteria bacterium]|nr:tannase/feruloyl esterase family alpha/beta hydrolase [Gammaproteobacteria bacterium]